MSAKFGVLGKAMSIPDVWVPVYTCPDGATVVGATIKTSCINKALVGVNAGVINFTMAISTNASIPATSDIVSPLVRLDFNLGWVDDCRAVSPGEIVYIKADTNTLVIRVEGIEADMVIP
jgi:hypothetical protein